MFQISKYLKFYDNIILGKPRLVVLLLLMFFSFLGYRIKDFKLDASADSLVLEHDEDLRYHRSILSRYGSSKFLLLIYTPFDGDIFSQKSVSEIQKLRDELKVFERVSKVVTILDVPLFKSPPIPLKEMRTRVITLESADVDKKLARKEIAESALFNNLLVSPDMKATAIQVIFKTDEIYQQFIEQRTQLIDKKYDGTMTPLHEKELEQITRKYKDYKVKYRKMWSDDIQHIRKIIKKYQPCARIFLGGVPMIANDMISFVRNDLIVFGSGIFIFLIITLGIIFRKFRWIFLPMLCCIFSAIGMMGFLGIFGWEVTVISSNFISLQLIFTMALNIHLIVRFNEVLKNHPTTNNREIILETVHTIFKPCLYTVLTTIAGFSSLMICGILPIVNFGWMMSMGLCVSFIVTFLFFPTFLLLCHKTTPKENKKHTFSMTTLFAQFTDFHGRKILIGSLIITMFTIYGITRLEVENSFIDYFKQSTEIYQGMKFVDLNLGGTTPLDVVISFDEKKPVRKKKTESIKEESSDEFFDEFDEFEQPESDEIYWYTREKMDMIQKIHDYLERQPETGKVLSLCTMIRIAEQINNGKQLDNFNLALMFKELPDDFRSIVLDPFVSLKHNEARITARIKDSMKSLRRNAYLKKLQQALTNELNINPDQVRLTNLMVLYNNMLQSLFESQIQTIGLTVLALMIMFMILFGSFKVSLIALVPNLISCLVVLGVMGILDIPLDMMTITIVAISIGIAVDNTIHYIHRFRHEFKNNKNYLRTMYECHNSIGKAMYYTSVTIIVGFSILGLSNFIPGVLFGMFTGLAMAMALLASLTLLPRMIILFKPFGPEK